eukprot:scaffold29369_cov57-Cyclotella_meneghiniana.AAC.8
MQRGIKFTGPCACGGGGTLKKEPTFSAAAPTITLDERNMDANSQIDLGSSSDIDNNDEPTSSPITSWEAWTSNKTDGSNNQRRVIGYTAGNEREEEWDPAKQSRDNDWNLATKPMTKTKISSVGSIRLGAMMRIAQGLRIKLLRGSLQSQLV